MARDGRQRTIAGPFSPRGALSPGSRGWQRVDLTRLRRGPPCTPLPLPTKEERTGSGNRYDNELECKGRVSPLYLSLSLSLPIDIRGTV